MTRSRGMISVSFLLGALALPACKPETGNESAPAAKPRPNLLVIVADDLGFSDLGCFGGEIRTPNLDGLAARGLRATDFHCAPTCSPTRAMLLSGTDNHVAGMGSMAEWVGPTQRGQPGYEGYLNDRVVSLASRLRDAGYHTYMAGKWHLGHEPAQWPAARGFERDLSMLPGAGSHWSDMLGLLPSESRVAYTRNGKKLEELPADYYSTKGLTDFLLRSIDEQREDGKPFFAYLSLQAPHGPLAVPDDWIDRCKGRYDAGYDALRLQRLERQKQMGIVGKEATAFPRLPQIPAWEELSEEQRHLSARKMELYASMIELMDEQIGRIIDHLRRIEAYDDTLVVFLSDNGPAGEDMGELLAKLAPESREWFEKTFDNRPENWGRPRSCVEYGPAWAQVSSVPFRLFKGVVAEGGIRVPLIVSGPGVAHAGAISGASLHVMDVAATLLEAAGIPDRAAADPKDPATVQGRSMWPLLRGAQTSIRTDADWLGWELFGNRAIRQGDWKLLRLLEGAGGNGEWQLFDLESDPAELRDRSMEQPERKESMLALWKQYVQRNGVIESDAGPFLSR